MYECDIKRELKHLERNKVITCDYEEKVFSLNKNFDEWKVSFHKLFDEEKFSKLLHINLSCGQSKNFADNKEIEAGNAGSESNLSLPKESIKKDKENNNTILKYYESISKFYYSKSENKNYPLHLIRYKKNSNPLNSKKRIFRYLLLF